MVRENLSIDLKAVLAFPILASTFCSVPRLVLTTLPRYVNSSISSVGPFVKLTVCKRSVVTFIILLLSLLTINPTELAVVSNHWVYYSA